MPQAPPRRATSESSDVAKLVTLHHRRRGWAWAAVGSVIGLVVYAGIGVNLFKNLTGTAETLSVIPVVVLLALALTGLVVVVVDTSRINRAHPAAQVSAKDSVSHYPVYARASLSAASPWQLGVRHRRARRDDWYRRDSPALRSELVGLCGVAERQDTFNPVSYGQAYVAGTRGGGCHTVTEGYLSHSGAHVTWTSQVPLGQPFGVPEPLWAWGTGRNLMNGDAAAIGTIIAGLFFDGVALLLVYVLIVLVRDPSPTRGKRTSVPAGPHPGAAHPAHHPDRGHHSDGGRPSARRGRGKR